MLSTTSPVGALTLPLPAGASQAQLADPVVEALLDFLAWTLCHDLDAKLGQLLATGATAVPAANRYSYDPFEARGDRVRRRVPSLFVWWDGQSQPWRPTQLQRGRQREVKALYIFQEHPGHAEMARRSGMFAAVDASWAKAADLGGHPSYSYGGKPAGTLLENSVGDWGSWDWEYLGGRGVQRVGIDDPNTDQLGVHVSGQHFPAFAAVFSVREVIVSSQPVDPTNVTTDSPFATTEGGAPMLDRTLEPTDGQDAEP